MQTEHITYKYKFSESEIKDIGDELAKNCLAKIEKENEKKDVMAGYNDSIKLLESKIEKASNNIEKGYEYRDVEAEKKIDFATNTVFYFYDCKIIHQRQMTEKERQMEIDFESDQKEAG